MRLIKKPIVHFIGIGGAGMSALAQYYRSKGFAVSGSDMAPSRITDLLEKAHITVKFGHRKDNVPHGASLVVVSQAIQPANPELMAARQSGVPIFTYPEAVGELTEQYKTIAIAGAHCKSTTTALAALALIHGGFDPTVIVGALLKEFGGKNFRASGTNSENKWLVLEADEFGRAFLQYSPFIAIATNIDREHLDVYKNLANIKHAFLAFFANVQSGGALILNRDDKNLRSLQVQISIIAKRKGLRVIWYSTAQISRIKRVLRLSGDHNLSNAAAVYELGKVLKISEKKILDAIGSYNGAWRRMEYRGKFVVKSSGLQAKVFDDYAHHPTEIKATLHAFRQKFPGALLVCIFQPHQAKRLQALFKEFISAFTETDVLILIPSYKVAGRDKNISKFTAERLASVIAKKYPSRKIYYLENPAHIKKMLNTVLSIAVGRAPSLAVPVVVMMGAGDIVQYTDFLIK